ncbi:MAG TPA: flagellar basal body P-ring formation protein FlgA [Desulfobulbus sp.]|nr:flagellar basal body P-ring formation protein FlgA [Desulfobulbus sp.]
MKYSTLLLLLITAFLQVPRCAGAVEVIFHETATVTGRSVTLADVADVSPAGPQARRLAGLEVALAPAPGTDRELQAVSIIARVRNNEAAAGVAWKGSQKILVHREGIRIDRERIKEIIADFLARNVDRLPRAEYRFTSIQAPSEIILPTGRLDWSVTPSDPGILGSSSFSIVFRVDGRTVKNCTVRGHLEALAPVVTARVTLKKGVIILPDQVTMSRRDIAALKDPVLAPDQVIGLQARRTIARGRAIERRYLEQPPVIRKGELVKIFAIKGPMRISTTGIATRDGRTGDVIRVKNISSSKYVYCRVDAPGIVSVEF